MGRIAECSVIIKDDFNNIFIVRRKTKRNEPKLWYIVGKKIRGKETEEKCIARAIKDDLKSIIFNLEKLGEIKISAEKDELCAVYLGQLKEKIVYAVSYTHLDVYKRQQWYKKRGVI